MLHAAPGQKKRKVLAQLVYMVLVSVKFNITFIHLFIWTREAPTVLYLCLGSRNELGNLEVIHDGLVEPCMLDCLFQIAAEKNLVGLDNLVRKRDLDGGSILLRTGLGGSRWNELDRRRFHSKNFSGELRWKSRSSSPFGSPVTTGIFSSY